MTARIDVWLVDDDESIRFVLDRALSHAEMVPRSFSSAKDLLLALEQSVPDVLLTDVRMPDMDGLELLGALQESHPNLPVIVMTAHSDLDNAVTSYQSGAFEYLPKPFDLNEVVALVARAVQEKAISSSDADNLVNVDGQNIIGEAPAMQEVFRAIGRLSHSNITVLITGESGTGKELVARALHDHSPRAKGAFVAVNTAAIPRDLMESEYFGHERGAFTGASAQHKGRFEQADGGTLFLDEIGDMPADLQTRLLRVLADGEFYRVGGRVPVKVDVRIIAATNLNLEQAVTDKTFREDLYHRLNVIRMQLPSLRERKEDVPLLLEHFMDRAANELAVQRKKLEPAVKAYLATKDWPGNVRELENLCRWMTVMAPGSEVRLDDLPTELLEPQEAENGSVYPAAGDRSASFSMDIPSASSSGSDWLNPLRRWAKERLDAEQVLLDLALPDFERALIEEALAHTGGHKQDAARVLGWGRNTLTRKLKELSVQTPSSSV